MEGQATVRGDAGKVRGDVGQGRVCTVQTVEIISLKKRLLTVPLSLTPRLKTLLEVSGHDK